MLICLCLQSYLPGNMADRLKLTRCMHPLLQRYDGRPFDLCLFCLYRCIHGFSHCIWAITNRFKQFCLWCRISVFAFLSCFLKVNKSEKWNLVWNLHLLQSLIKSSIQLFIWIIVLNNLSTKFYCIAFLPRY